MRYADGFDTLLTYDVRKFEHADAESLLDDWMHMLNGLELKSGG